MTWRREQLIQDRHLRDSARALVEADWRNVRSDLSQKSVGERAKARLSAGVNDVYDEAVDVAANHKGALAAVAAALIVWFAREPIGAALFGEPED